jgi:hypothetical protein
LPTPKPATDLQPLDEWELDAQGWVIVHGLGKVCLVNLLDAISRLKVESYPCLHTTNPPLETYQRTLRRAFLTSGLPRRISFDHGTVFFDTTTTSPFPTRLHLWLLALRVDVRFTRIRRPSDHAKIERLHQTMTLQALLGQHWADPVQLWHGLDARRKRLNQDIPSRVLGGQAMEITFDRQHCVFLANVIGTDTTIARPPQNMTVSDLMGELSQFLALPSYQLALPFSHQTWRELTYTQLLTGTD